MIDVLKDILSIYSKKKPILLFYLDNSISNKIKNYDYEGDEYTLFLNDIIYCIHKSTLSLDHIGKIIAIKDNIVSIKEKYKYSVHLDKNEYYIFIKRKQCKTNNSQYFAVLNDILDKLD